MKQNYNQNYSMMVKQIVLVLILAYYVHGAMTVALVNVYNANLPGSSNEYRRLRILQDIYVDYKYGVAANALNDSNSLWNMEFPYGFSGGLTFQGVNGKYLSICEKCWPGQSWNTPSAAAFANSATVTPQALWIPQLLSNGKYAFKGSNGKYLGQCIACGQSPNPGVTALVFAYLNSSSDPLAQWTIDTKTLWPNGNIYIRRDIGPSSTTPHLKICSNCGVANAVSIQVPNGDGSQKWYWSLVGNKVVIKGKNGNYLSRCNQCMRGAKYPDQAFVHAPNPDGAPSQWILRRYVITNGQYWTLQADNGLFLALCQSCAPCPVSKLPLIYVTTQTDENARWKIAFS